MHEPTIVSRLVVRCRKGREDKKGESNAARKEGIIYLIWFPAKEGKNDEEAVKLCAM